jgi:hypothetical protein
MDALIYAGGQVRERSAPRSTASMLWLVTFVVSADVIVLTVGELWISAAAWSLTLELADSWVPGRTVPGRFLPWHFDAIAGPPPNPT